MIDADEPIIELSDGTGLVRFNKMSPDEIRHYRQYHTLTPEQKRELEAFAEHLRNKKATIVRADSVSVAPPTDDTTKEGK